MACNSSGGKGGGGGASAALDQDLSDKQAWSEAVEFDENDEKSMTKFERSISLDEKYLNDDEKALLKKLDPEMIGDNGDYSEIVSWANSKLDEYYRDPKTYGMLRMKDRGATYDEVTKASLDKLNTDQLERAERFKGFLKTGKNAIGGTITSEDRKRYEKEIQDIENPKTRAKIVQNEYKEYWKDYQDAAFGKQNHYTSKGWENTRRSMVETGIAASKPLSKPLVTYRGVTRTGVFAEKDLTKLVGTEFKEKTWTSTTIQKKFAKDWVDMRKAEGERPVVMRILQPKGAKGFTMDKTKEKGDYNEHEWLTNSKGTYKIVKVKSNSDHEEVWIERRLND